MDMHMATERKQQVIGYPYTAMVERSMRIFYDSLNEKDKRHYVALEALKLCYGGVTYLSELLECDRSTIQNGMEDLKKK